MTNLTQHVLGLGQKKKTKTQTKTTPNPCEFMTAWAAGEWLPASGLARLCRQGCSSCPPSTPRTLSRCSACTFPACPGPWSSSRTPGLQQQRRTSINKTSSVAPLPVRRPAWATGSQGQGGYLQPKCSPMADLQSPASCAARDPLQQSMALHGARETEVCRALLAPEQTRVLMKFMSQSEQKKLFSADFTHHFLYSCSSLPAAHLSSPWSRAHPPLPDTPLSLTGRSVQHQDCF